MKVKLGDIFEIGSGGTPSKSHPEYYGGDIPWVKTGDLKSEYLYEVEDFITKEGLKNSSAKLYEPDTVLIAMYGATIGATSILKMDACTNQACAAFKKNDKVIPEYLYYFLKSQKVKFVKDGVGGAQPNISAGYLKKVEMELPSLDEQRAIVEVLDKTTNIMVMRNQEIASLDNLIKARFVEMFGSIHESTEYPYVAVKDLTDVISGGTPSRDKSEYWEDGTIPWVKTTELKNNIIVNVDEYITEAGLNGSSAKMVPVGTVLVAMYGQGKTRGMTAYLNIEACTNQACACILPSDRIDSMFMWKFFELSYEKLRSLAQGAGQPNLNGNMIKNFQVLVPPIELQKEYVDFVHQTDKSKVAIQAALDKSQLLFDSLMQKYFG